MSRPANPNGSGAAVAGVATAVPSYVLSGRESKSYLKRVFSLDPRHLDVLMAVVEHSQIERRFCVLPVDYLIQPRSLAQISREYQQYALALGRKVAADCLAECKLNPSEIDMIITVSCTGVMIPSLDAYLANDLGFRSDLRRLPITELGCAAGAAALTRAWEFIRAFPDGNVLIVAVELPSLTFQRADLSQASLIASLLFGDGAAAVVVTGPSPGRPRILDAESYLFPSSIEAMGFDLKETGFHLVLSKDVPQMIRDKIKELAVRFLGRSGLTMEQISAFILHPGGQKLLTFMEEELGLCRCKTQFSWDVLREYGNLSSASVLFVLQRWLTHNSMRPGDYGLLGAFGPGFSSEMLLLRWT